MHKTIILTLLTTGFCNAQSITQTINSGGIANSASSASVGEIIIIPTNPIQSNSGIIGILTQINQQTLEVSSFEITKEISVYPNPTISEIYFKTDLNIIEENIVVTNLTGKTLVSEKLNANKSLNLQNLPAGIYIVTLQNQNKTFKIIKH